MMMVLTRVSVVVDQVQEEGAVAEQEVAGQLARPQVTLARIWDAPCRQVHMLLPERQRAITL